MALATLTVDIIARLANIEQGLNRVGHLADQNAKRIEERFESAGKAIAGVFAAVVKTVTVGAIVRMVQVNLDAADSLSKLAAKTGETTETLSKLQYAGSLADVSNEALATSLQKLTKRMSDAARGSREQVEAFDAIGVSVTDSTGKLRASGDVLNDIADRFAGYEDSAAKAALAQALFGKTGAELIPLLNAGSAGLKAMGDEAEQLGVVISGPTGKAAEEFNDTMTRVRTALSAIGTKLAVDLLPLLQLLADGLFGVAKETAGAASQFNPLLETLRALAVLGANVAYVFQTIGKAAAGTAAQIDAFVTGGLTRFREMRALVAEDLATSRKSFDALERRILTAGQAFSDYSNEGRGRVLSEPRKSDAPTLTGEAGTPRAARGGRVAKAVDDGQKLVEQLRERILATQQLTEVEKLEIAIADGKYRSATAANLELARGYAATLDALKTNAEAAATEANALRERAAAYQQIFDATRTPMEALNIEIERLMTLLDNGTLGEGAQALELFGRAASAAGARFQAMTDQATETLDEIGEFAKSAARNMQSAFADFLFDPFAEGTTGMLRSFGDTLKRMVAEAASAQLMKTLFGDLDRTGSVGGLIGRLFGALPKFASGTDYVPRDMVAVIHQGEKIVPASRNRMGMDGVNIVVNVSGAGSSSDVRRAAGQGAREALAALNGARRYG